MKNSTAHLVETAPTRFDNEVWPEIELTIDALVSCKDEVISSIRSSDDYLEDYVDKSLRLEAFLTDLVGVVFDDGPEYALQVLLSGLDGTPNGTVRAVLRQAFGQFCAWEHAIECLAVIAEAAKVGPKVPYLDSGRFDWGQWLTRLDEDFDSLLASDITDRVCQKLFETQPA